jgi:hypothetical protein
MDSIDSQIAAATQLLRGTDTNLAICALSMGLSVLFSLVGVALMTVGDVSSWTSEKTSALQSLAFLLAQSFTLSRVARDFWCFKVTERGRPSAVYFGVVSLLFLVALGFACFSLVTLDASLEWSCLDAVALAWIVVSVMCLSKAVRDRADAAAFAARAISSSCMDHEDVLSELCASVRGTVEYRVCVWSGALVAVCLMLCLTWSWGDLTLDRKGFISICAIWCETSCFHFAKLVRDRADSAKADDLKLQLPYQVLVSVSLFGSVAVLVGAAAAIPVDVSKRLFLWAASGFLVTSTAFLAKHVRDQQELVKLQVAISKRCRRVTPASAASADVEALAAK